eukprot:3451400-Amphidinium_carterae.1
MSEEPALDTGASHSLHPIEHLDPEVPETVLKKIYLNVAVGKPRRALLYRKMVFAKEVSRTLWSATNSSSVLKPLIALRTERQSTTFQQIGNSYTHPE